MASRPSVTTLTSLRALRSGPLLAPWTQARFKRYEAFDAHLDKEALAKTRDWYQQFEESHLPKGNTTFARSSGAGGQHVNKTETKAVTVYPVWEILALLPKTLHSHIRTSRYYTSNNDSLTFQAQTSRSRTYNVEDNRRKLMDEIKRIYRENTPNETSDEKKEKYEEVTKNFHESRVKTKKYQSSKKQSRKGSID